MQCIINRRSAAEVRKQVSSAYLADLSDVPSCTLRNKSSSQAFNDISSIAVNNILINIILYS